MPNSQYDILFALAILTCWFIIVAIVLGGGDDDDEYYK